MVGINAGFPIIGRKSSFVQEVLKRLWNIKFQAFSWLQFDINYVSNAPFSSPFNILSYIFPKDWDNGIHKKIFILYTILCFMKNTCYNMPLKHHHNLSFVTLFFLTLICCGYVSSYAVWV